MTHVPNEKTEQFVILNLKGTKGKRFSRHKHPNQKTKEKQKPMFKNNLFFKKKTQLPPKREDDDTRLEETC